MAVEVYIPMKASFQDHPLEGARVLTLYDVDSDKPHGSMTLSNPPKGDTLCGPLDVVGHRDGKLWHVAINDIQLTRSTAVGIEFDVRGSVERAEGISDQEVEHPH